MFSGKTVTFPAWIDEWLLKLAALAGLAAALGLAAGLDWSDRELRLYAASTFRYNLPTLAMSAASLLMGAALLALALLARKSKSRLVFSLFLLAGVLFGAYPTVRFILWPLLLNFLSPLIPSAKPSWWPLMVVGPKLAMSGSFVAAMGAFGWLEVAGRWVKGGR